MEHGKKIFENKIIFMMKRIFVLCVKKNYEKKSFLEKFQRAIKKKYFIHFYKKMANKNLKLPIIQMRKIKFSKKNFFSRFIPFHYTIISILPIS